MNGEEDNPEFLDYLDSYFVYIVICVFNMIYEEDCAEADAIENLI